MTNVCYVVDAPFLGGAERYVSRVALGLAKDEFRPSLVVRETRGDDGGLRAWAESMADLGLPVERVPMRLPFRPLDAIGIQRALEAASPHVVHINMPGPYDGQMGLVAPIARMCGARAVVVTEHLPMVARLWKRALVKRMALHYVDAVLTVARANVPYLVGPQSVPSAKIRVIPNGLRADYGSLRPPLDEVRGAYGIPAARVAVAFVGNLLRHKGLHRLIATLSEVGGEDWHLVVVGTGPEEARCRSRVDALGLGGRATFAGAIAPDEVERLLSAVDILALPSTTEGMPYVVLEAMACSLPVVAGRVYGIPEMVRDGEEGHLVDPTDVAALSRALGRLIADASLRERMGSAGRARFEELFTLERQVSAIEGVYRELLGSRGRAP
jgi:glycosyltransferase involved in cell wall biosynthesis